MDPICLSLRVSLFRCVLASLPIRAAFADREKNRKSLVSGGVSGGGGGWGDGASKSGGGSGGGGSKMVLAD